MKIVIFLFLYIIYRLKIFEFGTVWVRKTSQLKIDFEFIDQTSHQKVHYMSYFINLILYLQSVWAKQTQDDTHWVRKLETDNQSAAILVIVNYPAKI